MTATKDTPMTASDISRLFDEIANVRKDIGEVASEQKAQKVLCGQRLLVVDKLDKQINGNGKDGLVTEMATGKALTKSIDKNMKTTNKRLLALVTTVVIGLLTIVAQQAGVELPEMGGDHQHTETPEEK